MKEDINIQKAYHHLENLTFALSQNKNVFVKTLKQKDLANLIQTSAAMIGLETI